MCNWEPTLFWVAFAYASAAVGVGTALLIRAWNGRRGRLPSSAEAAWCAVLPPLAVLALPSASALSAHAPSCWASAHAAWHSWEQAIHAVPAAHGTLHVANVLLLVFATSCCAHAIHMIARRGAFAKALRAHAQLHPVPDEDSAVTGGVYRLPSSRPLCFTVGVLKPAVYLSTGLLETLSPRDYEIVLAHEAAHVRRRDGLTNAFLTAFYNAFPLPGSRRLRADWERAAERACDAEAARRVGSPCDVAAVLVHVAHLMHKGGFESRLSSAPGVPSFAAVGDDIAGRVQALLSMPAPGEPTRENRSAPALVLAPVSLALVFATDFWLRHAVELFVHH